MWQRAGSKRSWLMAGALIVAAAAVAEAQEPGGTGRAGAPPGAGVSGESGGPAPSRAEFARLQAEVREQKQLLIDMLQSEQQRYDMLLKIIRAQGGGATAAAIEGLPPVAPPLATGAPAAGGRPADERAGERPRAAENVRRTAPLEGKIDVAGGRGGADIYVYVENVRAAAARGKSIEIKQENKQFSPRLAVVQAGTNVVFPNMDAIYHNVFSSSPRNSFDLGSYRAGDKARSVTLTAPGVVEIFCNMHQKMSANVLVVPSPLFTKVRADGSFRIDNVPVGVRRVVAWSPGTRAVQQRVDLGPAGAEVRLALEREDPKGHTNKLGQAYGSYRD